MAIPRKLNDDMITALSEYVRKGNYAKHASYLCGIDEHTLIRWLNQAQSDIDAGLTEEDSIFIRLNTSIKRARAEAQADMVEVARNAAKTKRDGYLAITFLERTDPDNWGRRERRDINIESRSVNIVRIETVLTGELVEGEVREIGGRDALQERAESQGEVGGADEEKA